MKRQELKNLLRGIKPDGDISDIVDQIMELNGADIENAKKNAGTDYEAVVAERDKWKAEIGEIFLKLMESSNGSRSFSGVFTVCIYS